MSFFESLISTIVILSAISFAADPSVDRIDSSSNSIERLQVAQPLVASSQNVYAARNLTPPAGRENPESGFKAQRFDVGNTIIVAFAGTEGVQKLAREILDEARLLAGAAKLGGWKLAGLLLVVRAATDQLPEIPADVKTDAELFVGFRPLQFTEAVEYVRSVRADAGGKSIVLTGHSLGGALAAYAGSVDGGDAVTFNAPYLNHLLRSDRLPNTRARIRAFEAIRAEVGGVPRDAVSDLTRRWFGDDPLVSRIEVQVPAQDPLLHSLGHFHLDSMAEATNLRWVKPIPGKDANIGGKTTINLPRGTPVLELSRQGDVMEGAVLAVRRGYIHASLLSMPSSFGSVTYASITRNGSALRRIASTQGEPITRLQANFTVQLLGVESGQVVDGNDRWHRVQFMVVRRVSIPVRPDDLLSKPSELPAQGAVPISLIPGDHMRLGLK